MVACGIVALDGFPGFGNGNDHFDGASHPGAHGLVSMINYWIVVRDNISARARLGAAPVPGPLPTGANIDRQLYQKGSKPRFGAWTWMDRLWLTGIRSTPCRSRAE
jgi:hypothetical protein